MAVKPRTDYERKVLIEMSNVSQIDTDLAFFGSHNGLRKGKIHTFLGNAGAGKSTISRTIVFDYLSNNYRQKPIYIWMSEETTADFETEFFRAIPAIPKITEFINMFSEIENDCTVKYHGSGKSWLQIFENEIIDIRPEVVILDNITTSALYAGSFAQQEKNIIKLKEITAKYNFALVIFAHTGGKVTEGIDRLIDMDDVRGGKTLVNLSNFFYIMQRFKLGPSEFFPTLRIVKHRGQELKQGDIFYLDYIPNRRNYKSRKSLPFADFNEAFNSRQRLTINRGKSERT